MSTLKTDKLYSTDRSTGSDENILLNDDGTTNLKGNTTVTGTCTATTFSGSGASLTALPAANLTGTLPAISATNLTNVPAANITGTLPAIDGSNLTGIVSVPKENLIINGAFQVWQRQTDDTNNLVSGYCGPDRWQKAWYAGTVTGKRLALTSSDTLPWNDGFRYAYNNMPYQGPYHNHADGTMMIGAGTLGATHEARATEIIVQGSVNTRTAVNTRARRISPNPTGSRNTTNMNRSSMSSRSGYRKGGKVRNTRRKAGGRRRLR